MFFTALIGAAIGAVVGAAIAIGTQLAAGRSLKNLDWRAVAGSAAQGAVTGGVAGLTLGAGALIPAVGTRIAVAAATGVVGGLLGLGASSAITGQAPTRGQILSTVVAGALGGGLGGAVVGPAASVLSTAPRVVAFGAGSGAVAGAAGQTVEEAVNGFQPGAGGRIAQATGIGAAGGVAGAGLGLGAGRVLPAPVRPAPTEVEPVPAAGNRGTTPGSTTENAPVGAVGPGGQGTTPESIGIKGALEQLAVGDKPTGATDGRPTSGPATGSPVGTTDGTGPSGSPQGSSRPVPATLGDPVDTPATAFQAAANRAALPSADAALLRTLDPSQRVTASVDRGFGPQEKSMTVAELARVAADPKTEQLQVRRVEAPEAEPNVAPVRGKFVDDEGRTNGWLERVPNDDTLHDVQVQLASGETVSARGNKAMLTQLANDPNVKSIAYGDRTPGQRFLADVPEEQRTQGYDALAPLNARIGPGVRQTLESTGLTGAEVQHGTIKGFEGSVRAGPQNVGKGFGGRGLYVSVRQPELARFFAEKAADEAGSRVSMLPEGFQRGPDANKPVVLEGTIPANPNTRVGVFKIVRDGAVDLEHGVLPSDWDNNPSLRALLEREFDVLDLRGMQSSGLVIDSDRFIVVHQSAGPGAIHWR